ncbi:MAG: alanine--glyoxylate aminotransferase family protein [Chlorobi bacterium]|nr:alanine--glyoxylate aminotransferase family protein [Chlorobiota bacterium]MCI0714888.1 alanine--glyoxylate aminotransferase family protein [Chlorobiota bacterium]
MLAKKVFTPGPTQVPPEVLKAVVSSITYHRSRDFKEFHKNFVQKLKQIFLTEHNLSVLTSSGTGAMEAAVVNFCSPGDNVLFFNQGKFGARWGAICRAYGLNAAEIHKDYGNAVQTSDLKDADLSSTSAIFLTHSETSTATLTDIRRISEYIRANSDALIAVDAITSIGAIEFRMDEWGIDIAVSASQKGLMTPPGLSVIAYSEKAKSKMIKSTMPRFYFDLRKEIKSFEDGLTMWTPAVGLFYGLDKACDIILNEGLENKWKRVHGMAEYFRNESLKNGFGILSKSPSDSMTAVTLPDNIPTGRIISALKEKYGIQIANGKDELRDKIARVSHMGDLELSDFVELSKLIRQEFTAIKEHD